MLQGLRIYLTVAELFGGYGDGSAILNRRIAAFDHGGKNFAMPSPYQFP